MILLGLICVFDPVLRPYYEISHPSYLFLFLLQQLNQPPKTSENGSIVSLLCWHLISLDVPYASYDIKKHMAAVVVGGERPKVRRLNSLSSPLRDAIINGWNTNTHKRPSMEDLCSTIQQELVTRKQNVKKNSRRSTVAGILRRSQVMRDRSSLELGRLDEIDSNDENENEEE